jgi:hypothetical protein
MAVSTARGHLALWNALRPGQRRDALSRGVRFASLAPAQQRIYVLASTGRLKLEDVISSEVAAAWTPELLQASMFRLEMKTSRSWRLRSGMSSRSVAGPKSREEAVAFFKRDNPNVDPEQVKEVVRISGEFQYGPPGQPLVRSHLLLSDRRAEERDKPQ